MEQNNDFGVKRVGREAEKKGETDPLTASLKVVNIRMVEQPFFLGKHEINNPKDVVKFLADELKSLDREIVCALNLNAVHRVINCNFVSVGSLNSSMLVPRDFMKSSILSNAASTIALHVHPSGDCSPSHIDMQITSQLEKVGHLLGVPLLDHIIVGGINGEIFSFFGT